MKQALLGLIEMQIATQDLRFFHGTSTAAAASILSHGARNALDEMGWRAMASEVWTALLCVGNESEIFLKLLAYEDLLNSPGLTALRSAHQREDGHLFVYGQFFGTLNLGHAYRYAVRNPFRSEFLHSISVGLTLLERCGAAPQANEIGRRHALVSELINKPSPPVVLELAGIAESRLSNENGSKPVAPQIELYLSLADQPGVDAPASFRVSDVTPSDVAAVHDLRGWSPDDIESPPWQPDRDRVAAARKNPKRWLAERRG